MPAPSDQESFAAVEMPRHPHSPPSYREVHLLTAVHDSKLGPRSPVRDATLANDARSDAESMVVEMPFTPERNAPPSYEDAMMSPVPTEAPQTPERMEVAHGCPGEGARQRGG